MPTSRPAPRLTTLLLCLTVLAAAAYYSFDRYRDFSTLAAALSKQRLHPFQLALERYAVDHDGLYPATLELLVSEKYLDAFPANPYDRRGSTMPQVALGRHVAGGISYLPRYRQDHSGARVVDGYALLVYGDLLARQALKRRGETRRVPLPDAAGERVAWDYVLLVLTSWNWRKAPPAL